jgi:hypothetical protein
LYVVNVTTYLYVPAVPAPAAVLSLVLTAEYPVVGPVDDTYNLPPPNDLVLVAITAPCQYITNVKSVTALYGKMVYATPMSSDLW